MSSAAPKRPGVGVGVVVTSKNHPGCVLMGKRKGKITGTELYSLPGGHLEFGEEWTECGAREVLEETGLTLNNVKFVAVTNGVDPALDYHYVTLVISGEVDLALTAEPRNMEPEKCYGWEWRRPEEFPPDDELFPALRAIFRDRIPPFHVDRS